MKIDNFPAVFPTHVGVNRKKAMMQGFQVVELSAEAMQDPAVFAVALEELALCLRDDSIG